MHASQLHSFARLARTIFGAILVGVLISLAPTSRAAEVSSRELWWRYSAGDQGVVSREVFVRRIDPERSVASREVVFFRSSGARDVVSREVSLTVLSDVTVPDGFLAREYAKIPAGRADWMSLAVRTSPLDPAYLDLFVAATTGQYGAVEDEPDDFVYRVDRQAEDVETFVAFDASETDPIDIAFAPGGAMGGELYVSARHLDGYAAGDTGGALLRVDAEGRVSTFFGDAGVATAPAGLAFAPVGAAGYAEGLYCSNASGTPDAAFAVGSGGSVSTFQVAHAAGFECAAFAPGNAFGDGLYLGGADGSIQVADVAGNLSSFASGLGSPVQSMAFSNGHGFGERLYVLLGNGQVLRLDETAQSEVFLQGLLVQPLPEDVVRNDLLFTPTGDILHVTDALRGVVYGVQMELPTAVDEDRAPTVPGVTSLGNHPNPFNPATTIRFRLGSAERVNLAIYDAAGRLVRTLLRGESMTEGMHELVWNGQDDRGQGAASGIYHARMQAGPFQATHKLTLLK